MKAKDSINAVGKESIEVNVNDISRKYTHANGWK